MALDPNIILSGRLPNQQAATQGLIQNVQGLQNLQQAPFRNQLLQQQVTLGEQGIAAGERQVGLADQQQMILGAQTAVNAFERGDSGGVVRAILDTVPPEEQAQELAEFNNDPAAYIGQAKDLIGAFQSQQKGFGATAGQRERQDLLRDVAPALDAQGNFDPEKADARALSAAQELNLIARPGTITGLERIAGDEGLAGRVASSRGAIKEAEAAGKAVGEASKANIVGKAKAQIKTAVKLAEKEATARGETLTDLKRADASLPGLLDVVGQLKELAPLVTSTFAGRIFDTAVKESGFGSTKGATARAKFGAIINNQVLPLLKQTFGAAFTFQEGESLKATMGDLDAAPDEKIAQLNAFIEGKAREVQAKERELGRDITPTEQLLQQDPGQQNSFTSSTGITFTVE